MEVPPRQKISHAPSNFSASPRVVRAQAPAAPSGEMFSAFDRAIASRSRQRVPSESRSARVSRLKLCSASEGSGPASLSHYVCLFRSTRPRARERARPILRRHLPLDPAVDRTPRPLTLGCASNASAVRGSARAQKPPGHSHFLLTALIQGYRLLCRSYLNA